MDEPLTPQQGAQARIDAIYADKSHPLHSLDATEAQRGAEEVMALTRITLGAAGTPVVSILAGPAAVPDSAPPVSASDTPAITTPETALALAEEMGFDKGEMGKLMDLEARLPAGRFSREQTLHGFGAVERSRLETLHTLGMSRLPLSLQIHLEQRGTAWAPSVFSRLTELGEDLEGLDAEIMKEAEERPGSSRLRELVTRRHGRQNVMVF